MGDKRHCYHKLNSLFTVYDHDRLRNKLQTPGRVNSAALAAEDDVVGLSLTLRMMLWVSFTLRIHVAGLSHIKDDVVGLSHLEDDVVGLSLTLRMMLWVSFTLRIHVAGLSHIKDDVVGLSLTLRMML